MEKVHLPAIILCAEQLEQGPIKTTQQYRRAKLVERGTCIISTAMVD